MYNAVEPCLCRCVSSVFMWRTPAFAEGLLPVTDRNAFPIFTVKQQNGINRLFVTFRNGKLGLW